MACYHRQSLGNRLASHVIYLKSGNLCHFLLRHKRTFGLFLTVNPGATIRKYFEILFRVCQAMCITITTVFPLLVCIVVEIRFLLFHVISKHLTMIPSIKLIIKIVECIGVEREQTLKLKSETNI